MRELLSSSGIEDFIRTARRWKGDDLLKTSDTKPKNGQWKNILCRLLVFLVGLLFGYGLNILEGQNTQQFFEPTLDLTPKLKNFNPKLIQAKQRELVR